MSNFNISRFLLLGAFSGITLGILSSFLPLPIAKIDFPDTIKVGQLVSIESEELPAKSLEAIARRYIYPDFQVDSYYIGSRATGDLTSLFKLVNINISEKEIQIKELSDRGFYATFNRDRKSYLSACINPQGTPTATAKQFLANRNRYNLNPSRFAIYALGLADLRDKRCLWVTISANQSANQLEKENLEKVWIQWLAYWQPKFPA
jgi:cyanosortase A-associated protein